MPTKKELLLEAQTMGLCCFWKLNKPELESVVGQARLGRPPSKFVSKKKIGAACKSNTDCRTNRCLEDRCVSKKFKVKVIKEGAKESQKKVEKAVNAATAVKATSATKDKKDKRDKRKVRRTPSGKVASPAKPVVVSTPKPASNKKKISRKRTPIEKLNVTKPAGSCGSHLCGYFS